VYETVLNLNALPEGYYYVTIYVGDTLGGQQIAQSEPIHLKTVHKKTTLLEYRNVDNFDITWTTQYIGRMRVPAYVGHKRVPGGDIVTSRNSDYALVNNMSRKIRGQIFEVYKLPPYLLEKLNVITGLDFWSLNGDQFQSQENWGDPEYVDKTLLASASIRIEQVGWLEKYNSHDLSSVENTGFIVNENKGFIISTQ
jgi:hypothetical protein